MIMKKVFLAIMLLPTLAHSFVFSPLEAKINPAKEHRLVYEVDNNSDKPIAVKIVAMGRGIDINGKETRTPADDMIEIYPDKVVLEPQQRRNIKVIYKGEKNISKEKAFRIIAKQVPVELTKQTPNSAQINYTITYEAALYVAPKGAEGAVKVASFTQKDKDLTLTLVNPGTEHKITHEPVVSIKYTDGKTETYKGESTKEIGQKNLLAGGTFKKTIKLRTGGKVASAGISVSDEAK
jgi:fimbrial chaperone protein